MLEARPWRIALRADRTRSARPRIKARLASVAVVVTPPTGGDLIGGFLARAGGAGKGWWPYWLTSTGASAARSYWENTQAAAHAAASGQGRPEIKLPVGFTTFPGEIFRAPRSWAEKSYPSLSYFHEADKGGHFAAWEEPELFATEVRAAFKPVR